MSKGLATGFDRAMGFRIRTLRKSLNMTQKVLAEHIETSFQQLQKYEKGQNRIPPEKLSLCAEAMQVPISYFFGKEDTKRRRYHKNVLAIATDINALPDELRSGFQTLVTATRGALSSKDNGNPH